MAAFVERELQREPYSLRAIWKVAEERRPCEETPRLAEIRIHTFKMGECLHGPDCWCSLCRGLENENALWKTAKAKKRLSTAELRGMCCSSVLEGGDTGKVYSLWGEHVTDVNRRQQQTRLMSHLLKKKKKKRWRSREVWGQNSKPGVVCPAFSPQWLADLCTTHRLIRTYRVVQRLRWQTAHTGWIQSQCVWCVCVCCLPSSLSSFCFELNLCIFLILQNSKPSVLDLSACWAALKNLVCMQGQIWWTFFWNLPLNFKWNCHCLVASIARRQTCIYFAQNSA